MTPPGGPEVGVDLGVIPKPLRIKEKGTVDKRGVLRFT